MIRRTFAALVVAAFSLTSLGFQATPAQPANDQNLLQTRETVWHAWFAGDTQSLETLVPSETIVISAGEKEWKGQAEVLKTAAAFHKEGGKLLRLEFPRTQIQHFGDVAVIWSSYLLETDMAGKRSTSSGRVTEIFHWKDGHWTNPGWHTDEQP
jgi:ketosteroid isomerase-like protein